MTHVEFQRVKDEYVAKIYAYMPTTINLDTKPLVPNDRATVYTCRNLLMAVGYMNQPNELALTLHGILQTANVYFGWLQSQLDARIVSATKAFTAVIQKEFPSSSLENWTIDLLNKADIKQRIAPIFEHPEWSDATIECIVNLEFKEVNITVKFKSRVLPAEKKIIIKDQLYGCTEYLSEKLIGVRVFIYDQNDLKYEQDNASE